MFEFKVLDYLEDVSITQPDGSIAAASSVSGISQYVGITAENRQEFIDAVTCFVGNLRSYLGLDEFAVCTWKRRYNSDIITMDEHGFMDSPGSPITMEEMIFDCDLSLAATEYFYVVDTSVATTVTDSASAGSSAIVGE